MDGRRFNKLAAAALGGIVAGAGLARGADKDDKPAKDKDAPKEKDPKKPALLQEPHVCRGLNACKGKGKGGKNDCAGQSDCFTAKGHTCGGENDCRGLGGCRGQAGAKHLKGKGKLPPAAPTRRRGAGCRPTCGPKPQTQPPPRGPGVALAPPACDPLRLPHRVVDLQASGGFDPATLRRLLQFQLPVRLAAPP